MEARTNNMRTGSLVLLAVAALLIPFTGLLMTTSDASLMWLMAISFFIGLFALVGGAFLADRAARE